MMATSIQANKTTVIALSKGDRLSVTGEGAWSYYAFDASGLQLDSGSYADPDVIGPFSETGTVNITPAAGASLSYDTLPLVVATAGLDAQNRLVGPGGVVLDVGAVSRGITDTGAIAADVLKRVLSNADRTLKSNPAINAQPSTLPSVTINTTADAALTNGYEWLNTTKRNSLLWLGGEVAVTQTQYRQFPSTTSSGAIAMNSWRVTFVADSAKMMIRVWHRFTTSFFRVVVDGAYVAKEVNDPTANNAARIITLDFSAAGGRKVREISIEGEGPSGIWGVWVGPTGSVWAPTDREIIKAYVVGDSYTDGADATRKWDGYARVMAHFLGWDDIRTDGIGGTGYIKIGTGQTNFINPARLGYVQRAVPDVVVVAGGYNDRVDGYDAIKAAAISYYQALRADAGTAKAALFFVGPWTGVGTLTELTNAENAIRDAVAAYPDDKLLFFIPQQSDPSGAWFTGSGHEGATAGDGNKDVYGSAASTPNGVHINTAGHLIAARRLSQSIYSAVAARIKALTS